MSTVIKAADSAHGVRSVAFNFDDLAVQADAYLRSIRAQAEKIISKAASDAMALRKTAEVEGRRAGEQAIDSLVDKKVASQLETVLPALRSAIADIERSKQGWVANWERQAIHLAAAMAARICRRELTCQPEIPLQLVREALELAGGNSSVRLHLNPDDKAAVDRQLQLLIAEFSKAATTEVIADPLITRGGCRVETEFGVIDQQYEAQLKRIEEELA